MIAVEALQFFKFDSVFRQGRITRKQLSLLTNSHRYVVGCKSVRDIVSLIAVVRGWVREFSLLSCRLILMDRYVSMQLIRAKLYFLSVFPAFSSVFPICCYFFIKLWHRVVFLPCLCHFIWLKMVRESNYLPQVCGRLSRIRRWLIIQSLMRFSLVNPVTIMGCSRYYIVTVAKQVQIRLNSAVEKILFVLFKK